VVALSLTLAGRRLNRHAGFPWGTLAVNVSGSFALGLVAGVAPPVLTVMGTAGLGAYTTFSSFARDAVALAEEGRTDLALAYVGSSCGLAVAAAWAGLALG
jgi:fluoride exporter